METHIVDEPARSDGPLSDVLLVLWHGAGGDVSERSMVAVAAAAAADGALVVRARFPYRVAGKRAPDRMPLLLASARWSGSRCWCRASACWPGCRSGSDSHS